jgi:hypothetical protein
MTTTIEEINNVDINAWRNGYKWSVNECLRLEREYDLLKLSVPEMAILHKRTMNAIMFKLQAEGLDTFNNLYFKTYGQNYINEQINQLNNLYSDDLDEDEEDEEDEDLDDEDLDDEDLDDEDLDDEDLDEDLDDEDEEYDKIYHDHSNGSNRAYIFDQVKSIHNHLTNLLKYFTPESKSTKEFHSSNL